MKASHQGWVQIQSKGFLHKWKQHYCAIFSTNQFGKARLEIYASEANFELAKNGKTVLLADCISIRPVSISPVNPNGIQIQLNNGTIMMMCLGNAEDTQVWQSALSRAAFPDQHQTTSISHMGSPTPLPSPAVEMPPPSGDEPAYDVPWDLHQFHVLLIANAASIRAKIAEGNYELCFKDSLLLKDGIKGVEAWSYDDITWFGYGDSCFAFQALGSSTFEFKCSRPSDVYEALRTYLRLDNDNNAMPYNLKDNYLVSYVPLERRRAPTVNEGEDFERDRSTSAHHPLQKMTSNASFMSQVLPSPQRDMNISRDSHHSEAAGATQPKQQKSRRFSFFRRSKKEKKDKQEKVKDNGPGRADFEQSTHNEWVMYQQSNQIDPSRQMPVTRPYDAFEEPSSPAYANVPLVNYQRNQYNGGLAALSDASPPPPFDPRSPRGYLPPDRFDISHQEISPPMKPAVPSRANVNNALSFKRQLEETIAAKKAVRDASPPIPRLPPIAEIPRPNHHASFRQRPPTQRPSDSRLRDSIVSEPPTDFVIDARVNHQRPHAVHFQFPSNGYGQHGQDEENDDGVHGGIPLVASQAHRPKQLEPRRLQVAPNESLIN